MKNFILIFLHFFAFFAEAQTIKSHETYYSVDKLEIYNLVNNSPELMMVNYFEGKIILNDYNNLMKCISIKTGEEYLKFETLDNNNYKIYSAYFKNCTTIISKSELEKQNLRITLKDDKVILIYYLSQLAENGIYSSIISGSGILINNNTLITNFHVVKSFNKLTIEFQNKIFIGKVIRFDESLDIALIKVDDNVPMNKEHLNFANYNIEIGKQSYASGYPFVNSMGKELKITSGIISSTKGFKDDDRYFQTTAPIDPGNSGGALIDDYGNIIGITSAKYSSGTNVGYALKIEFLIKESYISKTTSIKRIFSPQQIYNKAKNTICIVKSYIY